MRQKNSVKKFNLRLLDKINLSKNQLNFLNQFFFQLNTIYISSSINFKAFSKEVNAETGFSWVCGRKR